MYNSACFYIPPRWLYLNNLKFYLTISSCVYQFKEVTNVSLLPVIIFEHIRLNTCTHIVLNIFQKLCILIFNAIFTVSTNWINYFVNCNFSFGIRNTFLTYNKWCFDSLHWNWFFGQKPPQKVKPVLRNSRRE